MLERRYADNPHVTISMNDTGNPVGTTDPARVEVLIDIDNGTVFTAGSTWIRTGVRIQASYASTAAKRRKRNLSTICGSMRRRPWTSST